jgi:HK97 family phage major capsid protein/HK97 family phage prohead protease
MTDNRPPRDNLVRAIFPGPEFRAGNEDGRIGTMSGEFAVFNQWTEINSVFEGRFMERIAHGAFARTFTNNRDAMRVTFQHGKDPQAGDKPLGPIDVLEETSTGAHYEVPLLDTSYNRDLLPGLKAGLYGASFRFRVTKEDFNDKAKRSATNPEGLPERTITEAHVSEFGPVTYPAYQGASAGVRSLTDAYVFDKFTRDPEKLAEIIDSLRTGAPALPDAGPEVEPHSDEGTREEPPDPPPNAAPSPTPDPPRGGSSASRRKPVSTDSPKYVSRADRPARIDGVLASLKEIADQHDGVLTADRQAEWDRLTDELASLEADQAADEARLAILERTATKPQNIVRAEERPHTVNQGGRERVRNIYDFAEIRHVSRDDEDHKELLTDTAKRVVEAARFPQLKDKTEGQAQIERLLDNLDDEDKTVAKRIIATGSPAYRRAMHKTIAGLPLMPEEQRAMGIVTGSAGGFGITFDLDPTMIQTSNGAVVPYRRAARVVNVTTNEWRGVTSGGVTAAYAAEAAVSSDNSPTLAQPAALVQKAQCFVPFSMEIQGDYAGLEAELAREIQDAKDVLEATQFSTGAGTTVFPQGIVTGATTTSSLATTGVVAAADLYNTEVALPPRFRTNARWFANRAFYNRIRAIDTAGGAQLWTQNLTVGLDSNREGNTNMRLLGYPAEECSGISATITGAGNKIAVFGDASYFVIVDRVGLNLELVPIIFGASQGNLPTGQRGLYAWWRNTSKVLSAAAFQTVLTV